MNKIIINKLPKKYYTYTYYIYKNNSLLIKITEETNTVESVA